MMRVIKIDCVNKIKYEQPNEFKDSFFVDVYAKAVQLANIIIEDNIELEKSDPIDNDFYIGERLNNIISFWGERGVGKSSAMLSFALYLKNYRKNASNLDEQFDFSNLKKKELVFHLLPRIDATMLTEYDSLLDVVLAKMWESFNEKFQDFGNGNCCANITKRSFSDVKKSYGSYRKSASDDEKFSTTSIRELKELSKCLNLQEDLKKLVSSYLSCMEDGGEKFLVLAIDDLDMAMGNVYNTLEQVRLFLMIPRVIVLVTADYDRLYLECNRTISERLICNTIILEQEKRKIRSQTEKYLAKIFPGNMRVHMPNINMISGVDYRVDVSYMKVSSLFNTDEKKTDEKKVLFMILAKYTGIMLYPFYNYRHFLQKNFLRTIVNELYELDSMYSLKPGERFETACTWIQNALFEYGRTVVDIKLYDAIQSLLKENWDSVSGGIIGTILTTLNETSKEGGQALGYGQLLCLLLEMRENGQLKELIRFVLTLYSVQLAKMFHNHSESQILSEMKEIFYPSIERNVKRDRPEQIEMDKLPTSVLQIQLTIPQDVSRRIAKIGRKKISVKDLTWILQECLASNEDLIYQMFKLVSLGEWNFWKQSDEGDFYTKFEALKNEKIEREISNKLVGNGKPNDLVKDGKAVENSPEDGSVLKKSIQEQADSQNLDRINLIVSDKVLADSRVSIEIMLLNVLSYEDNLKGFLKNICMALCKILGKCDTEKIDGIIDGILKKGLFKYDIYKEWKERYKVETMEQLLPLQSAEVMFELVADVSSVPQLVSDTDLVLRILNAQRQQMDRLIKGLKKVESYYATIFDDCRLYSVLLEEYCTKFEPYNINLSSVEQGGVISPNPEIE